MTTTGIAGLVADLWRFPVKSMRGERLTEAEVDGRGMVGDRVYALFDVETGAVVSATDTRLFPGLLDCQATFVEPPRVGEAPPPVRITLPDGAGASSDSGHLPALLSGHFRREVTLVRAVPAAYAATQAAYFAKVGVDLTAPADSFVDLCPLSIITTTTLERLGRARPDSRFDLRRFRMNVLVETDVAAFVDNDWVGGQLIIGEQVRIAVSMPDPRCAMTTLPQGELSRDPEILRTVTRVNSLSVGAGTRLPCAGVYASVDTPGLIRRGDRVAIA